MELLNGKEVSATIEAMLATNIECYKRDTGRKPTLAVIEVGNDPASSVYIRQKRLACERVGIRFISKVFEEEVTESILLDEIRSLNNDPTVHGILIQLPLPNHLDSDFLLQQITPAKDVDGFHQINVGALTLGKASLKPCTAEGIISLLDYYDIPLTGLNAVVVGRSDIVGKPISQLLLQRDCTVTICHSKTKNLRQHTIHADLLIVAAGRKHLINETMVKPGAIVIDVGIHRNEDRTLTGDVDFERVKGLVSKITPVPGGVGPLTVATLLENVFTACQNQN